MSQDLPVAPEPPHSENPHTHDSSTAALGQPNAAPASMDAVSVIAFVFSVIGVGLVAIPLAIWGLVRTRSPRRGRGFAIAALCLSVAWAVASFALLSSGFLESSSQPVATNDSRALPAADITTTTPAQPSRSTATRSSTATQQARPLSKPKRVYWEDLKPGMCVRSPHQPAISVTVVDCRAGHDEEVMARTALARSAAWPGDVAGQAAVEDRCRAAFTAYIGIGFDDSRLEMDSLTTDKSGWRSGDHRLICLVLDPANAHLTRALRGSQE